MSQSSIKRVGYVGLGIMGQAMAANLLKAGYELLVWNRTASKMDALVEQGATACESPADVAGRGGSPQVIFINVTDTPDVEAILFGDEGVAKRAKAGLIVVDNSTISPVATRDFAKRLEEQDVTLIDAPVSGGDSGAKAGTLSIMVGGPDEAVRTVMPLLEVLGGKITHLGPTGSGQACKACNQIAVACNLLGACEAMALAKRTGLDVEKMIQVVSSGAGGSWQLENLGPKIAQGDHEPGFMIDLILKDLAIVADTARERHLPLPATSLVESYFRSVAAHDGGKLGTQAIAKAVQEAAGLRFSE